MIPFDPKMALSRSVGFPRHRLGRRVALHVLLFGVVATLLATAMQLHLEYQHEREMDETRLRDIQTSHLPIIVQDLWLTRFDAVTMQLQGIANLPNIRYAWVKLADGEEIFQGRRGGETISFDAAFPW
ncbi:MAG: hypothetical protein HQM02_06320 [Magnetococcales bacterium]|nr:hypothetical protein [Magnetococcales bacterium]